MDFFNSPDFTSHVDELLKEWHCPGVAIAIVQHEIIASQDFGNASLEPQRPVTADTLFDIASSSKSLTAASVALLVEDDDQYPQVQWDTAMSSLLPDDFVMSGKGYTESVTVEDILSHRTGLAGHDLSYLSIRAKNPDTPRSVTRNLRNLPVNKPIRTGFQYSNMMFTVASHLIETLTNQSFADFLKTHFFKPLGMNSTHLQPKSAIAAGLKDRIASPYQWDDNQEAYKPVELQQIPESQGAGSIFTSVNDYIKYVKALMNHQEPPITEEIYKSLTKPRIISNPSDSTEDLEPLTSPFLYAVGLEVIYYRGHKIVQHQGGDPGIGSIHFFLPTLMFGGVILGNSGSAPEVTYILARELIDAALQVPENQRSDWNKRKHDEDESSDKEEGESLKKRLGLLDLDGSKQPQKTALLVYTGEYYHAGYHSTTVSINDANELFVDATDRTMGFTLTFEHVRDQTKYIAHSTDYFDGTTRKLAAQFHFENDRVAKMGLDLEPDMEELIWFDKALDPASSDETATPGHAEVTERVRDRGEL